MTVSTATDDNDITRARIWRLAGEIERLQREALTLRRDAINLKDQNERLREISRHACLERDRAIKEAQEARGKLEDALTKAAEATVAIAKFEAVSHELDVLRGRPDTVGDGDFLRCVERIAEELFNAGHRWTGYDDMAHKVAAIIRQRSAS